MTGNTRKMIAFILALVVGIFLIGAAVHGLIYLEKAGHLEKILTTFVGWINKPVPDMKIKDVLFCGFDIVLFYNVVKKLS